MTKDAETDRALETEEAQQLLPLVIEVLPGQAGEGLGKHAEEKRFDHRRTINPGRHQQAT
jgi:hypothetical protein